MAADSWKYLVQGNIFQGLQNDHPLRIAARTYAFSLSLSLGPALIPILTEGGLSGKRNAPFLYTLRKGLSATGFAFAMTVAVGGGAAADYYWRRLIEQGSPSEQHRVSKRPLLRVKFLLQRMVLSPVLRTFICNSVTSLLAIFLLQSRRRSSQPHSRVIIPLTIPVSPSEETPNKKTSATLDLTLLLLVRALDSVVQVLFQREAGVQVKGERSKEELSENPTEKVCEIRKRAAVMTDKLDAFVFWAASARIMWCFFYRSERLPRSYVKWIGTLANVDNRLLAALRGRKDGTWTYGEQASHTLLTSMAEDLGYPSSWGDTLQLPPIGGEVADKAWKQLGVKGRAGVGGLPCEIVHGRVGSYIIPGGVGASCFANIAVRGAMGFLEALAIYLPVHFLPVLLSRPGKLLSFRQLRRTILALLRSSLFLSVFISSIWSAVCFTRTLAFARLFPRISHNFIDGHFGCVLAGCLTCGGSIWIEQGKRRGEIALYVLPKALRSMLNDSWLSSGARSLQLLERLTFVLSLASILTASQHCPESLRGLSRWAVMSVMRGIGGGSRKNKD